MPHVHLYQKLDKFGKNYDASVEAILKQDIKWLAPNAELPINEGSDSYSVSQQSDSDDSESIVCPYQAIIGDKLRVERGVNTHNTLVNGFAPNDRLEGLHFEMADWHGDNKSLAVQNFLNVVFQSSCWTPKMHPFILLLHL